MNWNIGYCIRVGIGTFAMVFGFFLAAFLTVGFIYGVILIGRMIEQHSEKHINRSSEENDYV